MRTQIQADHHDHDHDHDAPYVDAPEGVKPVFSNAQIIDALTTSFASGVSRAWDKEAVSFAINTLDIYRPEHYERQLGQFEAMSARKVQAAAEAFALWDDIIDIDLVRNAAGGAADISFNYSFSAFGTYASTWSYHDYGSRAHDQIAGVNIWIDSNWSSHDHDHDVDEGDYGFLTFLHEIGHALGLSHPGRYNGSGAYGHDAEYAQDTGQYSVLSYFAAGADDAALSHYGVGGAWGYGATPLLHDILAAQALYGADMGARTGATIYGFNANAGRNAFDFDLNKAPVIAIWDAGGVDRIDLSGWSMAQSLDLRAGVFSSVGGMDKNLAIAYGAQIENAAGGAGDDAIGGNQANNALWGGLGDDALRGRGGADRIYGGLGEDALFGGAGADIARGGAGADLLSGGAGADRLFGGAGADRLNGGDGADFLQGGGGADALHGHSGDDRLLGAGGDDRLSGHYGDDALYGGAGADRLIGGAGDDALYGGGGADLLLGGGGHDRLAGDAGADRMRGHDGDDIFIFKAGDGRDWIMDFGRGADRIDFSAHDGFNGFDDVRAAAAQQGADVAISTGGGDHVFLHGVALDDLNSADFIF